MPKRARAKSAGHDLRVSTWIELQNALYLGAWNASLGRFRSSYAFRGVSDAARPPSTSLERLGSGVEGHLLRAFRKYARRSDVHDDTVWSWLALAQHHGLPTRLLDWTFSPYVALHFSTANLTRFACDGAVWCLDFVAAHQLLPPKMRAVLEDEGSNVFTIEMLSRVASSLTVFDALAASPFLAFFEPSSIDERIINQYALFSLLSPASARLGDWLAAHASLWRRIIIPAALKLEVRDKLDQANITERVLFPGLDGLACWLKRLYGPAPGPQSNLGDDSQGR